MANHKALPEEVRQQLDRILSHPTFRTSHRCQALLRYLVEHVLGGSSVSPKERTLGAEVFGRPPDYDTNEDPIVRGAASDIRKRIAQYYYEPEHQAELRIELPPGSYLPRIYPHEEVLIPHAEASAAQGEATVLHLVEKAEPEMRKRRAWSRTVLIAVSALLLIALCAYTIYQLNAQTALDRFWNPVLNHSERILLGIVSSSTNIDTSKGQRAVVTSPLGIPFVGLNDQSALLQVIQLLHKKNKEYTVVPDSFNGNLSDASISPSLAELRQHPVVLIGNSDWTQRLLQPLRFHPVQQDTDFWIADSQNPSSKQWIGKTEQPYNAYTQDYAIISRIQEPTTGQTVVMIVGLGLHGTAAAAEFVSSPADMNLVADAKSPEWKKKNVQIVISTKIAGDSWGSPQLLAKYFW
jgi:hypothetical protein